MVDLASKDRQQLISVLLTVGDWSIETSRRDMLVLSGLGALASRVDLSGSPFSSASRIVSYLAEQGQVADDQEALGMFLRTIRRSVGVENQTVLDSILIRYRLVDSTTSNLETAAWRDTDSSGAAVDAEAEPPYDQQK